MANDTFKLSIKLKIPKSSKSPENREGGGGGGGEESSKGPFSRFCHVCNKGFISGKALGGHMRMHVKAVNKVGDELCNNGGRSGNQVCSLCQKVFPSMKSMFGHMRSHPERTWRGTQPPQGANLHSSLSTVSDVDTPEFKFDDRIDTAGTTRAPAVDLSKSITNWPVTAKRGGASVSSSAASDSGDALQDPMQECASTLILFAITIAREANNTYQDSGDPHCLSGRKKRKVTPEHPAEKSDSFKPDSSAEAQGVCRNDEDDSFRRKINSDKKRKVTPEQTAEKSDSFKPDSSAEAQGVCRNDEDDSFRRKINSDKKRKVTPEHPAGKSDSSKPDSSAEAPGVCRNDEDDSFRRKNNSDKGNSGALDDEKPQFEMGIKKLKRNNGKKRRIVDLETKEAVAGEAKRPTVKQPENCNVYRCSTCSRTFSTHQALGGHRSGHNKGKNICAVEAQAVDQVEEEESEKERKILDLDLNEQPSPNEEEEAEVAENGIEVRKPN